MHKINPKYLLHSKWTAVVPKNKEKHFLVTEIGTNEQGEVIECFLQAVMSKNTTAIDWQSLRNEDVWLMGWK